MPTGADDLAGIVATAQKATEGLQDTELQRVAFERVLEHLLRNGDSKPAEASPLTPASAASQVTAKADSVLANEQQRADAIAKYFKISPDDVEHIFDVSGTEPSLTLHTGRLEGVRTAATRQIALLVTGVRTALGQETATEHIRSAVDNYGRLDSSNFMSTLGKMPEISVLGGRGSPNRTIRMKVSGVEKAQELAQQLIGE